MVASFYDMSQGEEEWIMELEIEGESRTEILYNLLSSEWTQQGHFIIEEGEFEDIIYDFLQLIFDVEKYDHEYLEYLATFYSSLDLSLDSILPEEKKKISKEEIFDVFCSCLKEYWEYSNFPSSKLDIKYKIVGNL